MRPALLPLLQLSDSALPVGGFAHSDGLEALALAGRLRGPGELESLLAAQRRLTIGGRDEPLVARAHAAVLSGEAGALQEVAGADLASRPADGQRQAALGLGGALVRVAPRLAPAGCEAQAAWVCDVLGERATRVSAFGALAAAFGVDRASACEAYAYTAVAGMVAAAVRLGLVGAIEAQAILRRVMALPAAAPGDGWASFSPLLDIAAMSHETADARSFAS